MEERLTMEGYNAMMRDYIKCQLDSYRQIFLETTGEEANEAFAQIMKLNEELRKYE